MQRVKQVTYSLALLLGGSVLGLSSAMADPPSQDPSPPFRDRADNGDACRGLPTHAELTTALEAIAPDEGKHGGLGNAMWATVVNRDGVVCAVTFSGDDPDDPWPGSRVISAAKAFTANAYSNGSFALATGNLFSEVQDDRSLFGLGESNPVDTEAAYGAAKSHPPFGRSGRTDAQATRRYGTANDPMVGRIVGGQIFFGGGLALYSKDGEILGGLGLSGDTSCADHVKAWRVRSKLNLANVPGGPGPRETDNLNFFPADGESEAGKFEHPECSFGAAGIAQGFDAAHN